nr:transposase [Bacilli bacterium]
MELNAQEIGALYRKCWQIELFFKWIKQHLVIKRFYGTSKWAVYNQLWLALITYGLLVKLRQRAGCKKRPDHPLYLRIIRSLKIRKTA